MENTLTKYVDFTLDVLTGCIHHCYGCNVNRTEENGLPAEDLGRLTALFDDFEAHDYMLANLALGPTDFMSAANTDAILTAIQPWVARFKAFSLQSTFLLKDEVISDWGRRINAVFPGCRLKFFIPLDPRHADHAKYISGIMRKINVMKAAMPDIHVHKTYAVFNLKEYSDVEEDPIHRIEAITRIAQDVGGFDDFDLVISEGRLNLNDLNNRGKLRGALMHLRELHRDPTLSKEIWDMLGLYDLYKLQRLAFDRNSRLEKFKEANLTYKSGALHMAAFVGQDIPILHPKFQIPAGVDWTYAGYELGLNQLLAEQVAYLPKTTACMECEFVSGCLKKGVIGIMSLLRDKDCIMPKELFESSRDMVRGE